MSKAYPDDKFLWMQARAIRVDRHQPATVGSRYQDDGNVVYLLSWGALMKLGFSVTTPSERDNQITTTSSLYESESVRWTEDRMEDSRLASSRVIIYAVLGIVV